MKEEILAYGHPNILSNHKTTIEITKDYDLTKNGDCIVGIKANKACFDLNKNIKNSLKEGKNIKIIFCVGNIVDEIIAKGSPNLILENKKDIVIRKSDFIDDRTLAINANKAACDLKSKLIRSLKDEKIKIKIQLKII